MKKKNTRKYTSQKKSKRSNGKPYRESEYEMYVLWKSLPTMLKGREQEAFGKLGITDELVLELLSIKSQSEFAKHFNIPERTTLSDWNLRTDLVERVESARRSWSKKLTSNIIMGLYRKAVQEGDAPRVKLWLQYIEGWVEKTKTEHTGANDGPMEFNVNDARTKIISKLDSISAGVKTAGDSKQPNKP